MLIKADSAEDAAREYLNYIKADPSEDEIQMVAETAFLIESKEGVFYDLYRKELNIGDQVAFLRKYDTWMLRTEIGKVSRFTKSKIFVENNEGESFSYMMNSDGILERVVKLEHYMPVDDNDQTIDALGQKLEVGDEAFFQGAFRIGNYDNKFFIAGKIKSIDKNLVSFDGYSRRKDKKSVVVIKRP